jgi:regulation of enolase protein 1 (concanavalin A-like superfamily)
MPEWMIKPPVRFSDSPDLLIAEAAGGSDFWRKTHYGFTRHHGHLYAEPVTGDFTMQVTFTGNYHNEYDQAGLMIWADETTWLKTGIEFTEGRFFASAVVTRDFSDWSTAPLPAEFTGGALTVRVTRAGGSVEIRYRVSDTDPWVLLRIAYLSEAATVHAGRMLAAPSGPGFVARFSAFSLLPLDKARTA